MLKVHCEACGAGYEVDPRRVPPNGMKMRCPACGASVHVAAPRDAPSSLPIDDLDLPTPKRKPTAAMTPTEPVPAPEPALPPPPDLADLPALRGLGSPLSARAAEDRTDLPARKRTPSSPKAPAPGKATVPARLPAVTVPAPAPPTPPPVSSPADELDLDLPAPKSSAAQRSAKIAPAFGGSPTKPAVPSREPPPAFLPSPPSFDIDLPAPKKLGGASRPLGATRPDVDLPAPKARPEPPATKPSMPRVDLDLPAPKLSPADPGFGKGPRYPDSDLDLPAPKLSPPADPSFGDRSGRESLDLDLPAPKPRPAAALNLDTLLDQPAGAPPKRSFAKPQESPAAPPLVINVPSGADTPGTLPKDSLALDPKPMFAVTPAKGPLGTLDDVDAARPARPPRPAPLPDLIDLPAPNDLPAPRRDQPRATALGLGSHLGRDALDLPGTFGGGSPLPSSEPQQPTRRAIPEPVSDLDLPAPRDLPALMKRPPPAATALGLGRGFGLPPQTPPPQPLGKQGGFELLNTGGGGAQRAPSAELDLDLPPMSSREQRDQRPELDLGDFEQALDNLESTGGGSFGAREGGLGGPWVPGASVDLGEVAPLRLPRAPISNTNAGAGRGTLDLAPNELLPLGGSDFDARGSGRADFGEELHGSADLSMPPAHGPRGKLDDFGELDLGLSRESSTEVGGLSLAEPIAQRGSLPGGGATGLRASAEIEDAELLGDAGPLEGGRPSGPRGARGLPGWALPLIVLTGIGAAGTALGMFTHHGWFGVYLIEQLLPASGDPAYVRTAIAHAEQQARSDTYSDLRKALTTLSDARNEAGLNRELLTRSLLHEALYQLRFGDDPQSAQRSASILSRVLERGERLPQLALARAADAARRGNLVEAKQLLADASGASDAFRDLLAGEIALLDKRPEAAERAFAEAQKHGLGARASWGVARARIAQGKRSEAEAAAATTLESSPNHAAAHLFLAEQALADRNIDAALGHLHAASGRAAVDGVLSRPSRSERAAAYALEGRVEEQRDHPREAHAAYERALADEPRNVDVLLGSGRMLIRLGRPQDALSRFDSALGANPRSTPDDNGKVPFLEAGLGAVQSLLVLGRSQEALQRSTALLTQFSSASEVKLAHGQALEALERFDEAERNYHEAIERAPKTFAGYVALSQLLFKRDRPEEAARVLERASSQVDDSAEVRRMLGYSELARNHLAEAIQQFEAALGFDKRDPGALFGLVVAQRKSGALDRADAALKRLEQADPTFTGIALERGQLLESRGDNEGAIATYRKALVQRPTDSDLKVRLGAALVTVGQIDEAEPVLHQVLKERPTSPEAEHYLGRVLFARNETAQAVQRFARAVNFDNLEAEYHMYLGWALLEQGNYGGAMTSIERAIELDPNLGDARWLLGRVQLRTGAVRDALVNLQAALRLKPGRVEALANMGDAYDELRELPQAIKSYEEAVKRAPEHGDWWYRLGRLQLDRGARAEAQKALAEAVLRGDKLRDRPTWLADAHRAYGDVLRESGRASAATDHYRLFLELAPRGHPERKEIENLLYKTRR